MDQYKTNTIHVLIAVALSGAMMREVHANETLARKNDCFGCHSIATKLVGPAFNDVAIKYSGQDSALEQLQNSIRNGSAGKWGEVPMPSHSKISASDLKKLATWVLSLKK